MQSLRMLGYGGNQAFSSEEHLDHLPVGLRKWSSRFGVVMLSIKVVLEAIARHVSSVCAIVLGTTQNFVMCGRAHHSTEFEEGQ